LVLHILASGSNGNPELIVRPTMALVVGVFEEQEMGEVVDLVVGMVGHTLALTLNYYD